MTAKLEALPRKHVAEMRAIVRNIKAGKYQHNQNDWHSTEFDEGEGHYCGTAHCFAGWKEVRDAAKALKTTVNRVNKLIHSSSPRIYAFHRAVANFTKDKIVTYSDAGEYAQLSWGLTDEECAELFCGGNSLEDIEEIIDSFAKGLRRVVVGEGPYKRTYNKRWVKPSEVTLDRNSTIYRVIPQTEKV